MTVGSYIQTIGGACSDGMKVGQSATDKIGFFGVTPVVQQAALTAVGTSAAINMCSVYGFTATQAAAIVTAINAIITELKALGLTA